MTIRMTQKENQRVLSQRRLEVVQNWLLKLPSWSLRNLVCLLMLMHTSHNVMFAIVIRERERERER